MFSWNPEWETPPLSEEEKEKVLNILQTPFVYLGCGNQSYVFENGEYVIKLFRFRLTRFSCLQKVKDGVDRLLHKKAKDSFPVKINKTFTAARMAFVEAQEYTQVVFCHLNLTEGKWPISRFIVGSRSVFLPMDRYRFVIQKKVIPFKEAMISCRKDPEKMFSQIDSLIHLLLARSALGIRNSDPTLAPNFGFYQGRAIEMDFGNYRKIPLHSEKREEEMLQFMNRLKDWLSKNAPEYVAYLTSPKEKGVVAQEFLPRLAE